MEMVKNLSRAELVNSVKKYARDEREALAFFLIYAAEAERRKVYRFEGQNSLFSWFRESFNMSESAACRRISIVKFLARNAELEEKLTDPLSKGEIHLDGLALILPFLEKGEWELINLIKGKSTREIDIMLAQKYPQQAKKKRKDKERAVVVPLTEIARPSANKPGSTCSENLWSDAQIGRSPEQVAEPLHLLQQQMTLGLEITTTLEGSEIEDLRRLQELLPGVSLKEIIAGALKEYRKKKDPALQAAKTKEKAPHPRNRKAEMTCSDFEPDTTGAEVRSSGGNSETKAENHKRPYIPVKLRREVYERDQGQCAYVSENGERCKAKGHLEIDHVRPVAQSGKTSTANCRLLCKSHNQFLAELHFGREFMESKRNAS